MNASAIRLTITQCVRRFLARERAFLRLWTGLGGFLLIGLAACDEPQNVPVTVGTATGGTAVATAGAGTSGKGGAAGAAGAGEVAGEGGAAGAGGQ